MKQQRIFLAIPLILALAVSSGCSTMAGVGAVVTKSTYVKQNIPLQEPPKAINFPDTEWHVVSEKNIDEFMAKIEKDVGDTVFFAITPKGYENLAIGVAEMRRYMLQQKEIINYYEKAIKGEPDKKDEKKPK